MIRFGIIGTNFITERFLEAAKLIKNFKLNAVYSRTEKRAKEFAIKYDVENIFTNLEQLSKSDLIDAIYIASPNSLHHDQTLLFLQNNKSVLCEKPIASNLKELKNMIEVSKKNKVLLMEALKGSFLPNYISIKENLYKIGKVRKYISNFCQYSSRYDKYKNNELPNTFNPIFSNGALMDIGIYTIYPLIDIFGMPKNIKSGSLLLDSGVDGQGTAILEYNEMEGIINYSKISNSKLFNEIQGEKGTILIDKISQPSDIKIFYNDGSIENITKNQIDQNMYYEIEHFINLIENNIIESPINTFDLSLKVMSIIENIRKQNSIIYPADNK
ncbi:Gfo/Idh/MocA family oxidoreductase [Oceanotoga sp. DSM 15011]|uniref:Gfo/Idh/MocA family protein n=1 Tax=Oceanotoga sp. DSM 15011 TaxID=2984951 RepID=UPI0021F45B3C|nr:Gfo/Idh/MocA family oxidoreductase [Oceanotoga sp. DSM 15011]UYO99657.1 Gfo/Idh/MocA family oxidoreductase [Oceanotoga sp. DSM 15011]